MATTDLTRTPSSGGNRKTWTFSAWLKRGTKSDSNNSRILSAGAATSDYTSWFMYAANGTDASLQLQNRISGSTTSLRTVRKFRDTNGWYHLVIACDTTQATASDRIKIYINGVQETDFDSSYNTYPAQNADTFVNHTVAHNIGSSDDAGYTPRYWAGSMSHVALVDGQQLTPTSFGQTDSTTGQWKFKSPSGLSWGTNGFHLKFENSGNMGLDSSGQTNNYSVSGGTMTQILDTPSNSYCTINPSHTINSDTLLNGNTRFDGLSSSPYDVACGGTLGFNKGKWYWEWKWGLTGSGNQAAFVGIIDSEIPIVAGGNPSKGVTYRPDAGSVRKDGSEVSSAYSGSANDIFGMAFDMDAGTLKLHKNGTYFNSGNAVVTGIDLTKNYVPYIAPNGGTTVSNIYMNWGNGFFGTTAISSAGSNGNGSLFEYDVPSGYYALNTKNLNTYG